ncbi:MAG: LutB/LldF family L-lactate oxidation iron-sulfur protein [Vicinamibacterales bacterium]
MTSAPLPFYRRVDAALRDATLQTALARATTRFVSNRANAFGALGDSEGLRDRARAIRAHALSRLDQLLARLADQVEARGGHVCWAPDAETARRYILELARAKHVRRIVKSKSMASEEIHLNEALEADGLTVVETDLGEYIIQLAGETPSHLIAPAIHKTREQVSALFERHLGIPPTDDVRDLTRAARAALRQEFLRADLGISGVNFGIANEGAVALVTTEGNGRLTTTLPRIHVAVMGIERIVESFEDLGVLLQVLARSATGQKLSAYTSIISGPARPGEADGPEEFHLVLLDNGRSRMLADDFAEALLCIRCGACLNACPVYQSIGGHAYGGVYSGPIGAVLTPLLDPGREDVFNLAHASSLCGACEQACPVRIPIPDLLLRLRARGLEQHPSGYTRRAALRAWAFIMAHPLAYRAAGRVGRLLSRVLVRNGSIERLPWPLDDWSTDRDFPAPPRHTFGDMWRQRERERTRQRVNAGA